MFRRSSSPFPARGTICSIVAVSSISVAPQYMQFHPSRFAIELTSNLRLEALRGFRSLFPPPFQLRFFRKHRRTPKAPFLSFVISPLASLKMIATPSWVVNLKAS